MLELQVMRSVLNSEHDAIAVPPMLLSACQACGGLISKALLCLKARLI